MFGIDRHDLQELDPETGVEGLPRWGKECEICEICFKVHLAKQSGKTDKIAKVEEGVPRTYSLQSTFVPHNSYQVQELNAWRLD